MQPRDGSVPRGLDWLLDLGIDESEVTGINPCVPGEFTMADTYYVNSATPSVVYGGAGEGTLPLVAGRWYMIPSSMADRYPQLRDGAVPIARATRLIPS